MLWHVSERLPVAEDLKWRDWGAIVQVDGVQDGTAFTFRRLSVPKVNCYQIPGRSQQ